MKTPFYINPDVLEKPWGSKYDILMLVMLIAAMAAAGLAFLAITGEKSSSLARIGIGGAYLGMLFGAFGHLGKQIKKGDEFVNKIISAATAYGGLYTILFVAGMTIFHSIRGMDNLAMWNLFAPIFFLFITYMFARITTRKFANLTV